jgi:hypothetical protein
MKNMQANMQAASDLSAAECSSQTSSPGDNHSSLEDAAAPGLMSDSDDDDDVGMIGKPVAGHEELARPEPKANPFDGYDFDVRNHETLEFEVPPRAECKQWTADWTYFEQLHSDYVKYDEEFELESSFEVPLRAVYERYH